MSRQRLLDAFEAVLQARRAEGLLRTPTLRRGTSFTSNDYLGLATDPSLCARVAREIDHVGVGLTGSRLLSGESALPRVAEGLLADFCGQPAAALFSSGYAANIGLLSAIAGPGDHVISDQLNHASLIDGMRLSGAVKHIYAHGDVAALDAILAGLPPSGRRFIVVESVYSMDGDLTDLQSLCNVADHHGAAVIVDEAHATGLYGARWSGRVEADGLTERVLCTVHTGGKALGSGGAWVAGPEPLIRYLHNFARSFIYSTAPTPPMIVSLVEAVRMLPLLRERIAEVHRKSSVLRCELQRAGFDTGAGQGCIIPVIVGNAAETLRVSAALGAEGFDVPAIRPPTVAPGASRLRLTVTSHIPDSEIARFVDVLCQSRVAA